VDQDKARYIHTRTLPHPHSSVLHCIPISHPTLPPRSPRDVLRWNKLVKQWRRTAKAAAAPTASAAVWARLAAQARALVRGGSERRTSQAAYSRFVLVGDQCQLPPTVTDESFLLAGASRSLFERLLLTVPAPATLMADTPAVPLLRLSSPGHPAAAAVDMPDSAFNTYVALRSATKTAAPADGPICSHDVKSDRTPLSERVPMFLSSPSQTPMALLAPPSPSDSTVLAAPPSLVPAVLTVQYRMHPIIAKCSSDTLYNGIVGTGVSVKDRMPPRSTSTNTTVYIFIHIYPICSHSHLSASPRRPLEVRRHHHPCRHARRARTRRRAPAVPRRTRRTRGARL
jgi:hypothetical protein